MTLSVTEAARPEQVVDAKSTQLGKDAHKDDVQQAAKNFLADSDFQTASQIPDSDLARAYTARMTEDLVKQNLLPSVSLSYVERNFEKIDTNKDAGKPATLTLDEVKAAQRAAAPGSIDEKLYAAVGEMMRLQQIPQEMTKAQIHEKLKEINNNFQSQDKKNAVDAASLLMDNRALFNNIAENDEEITKADLVKFLEKPGNASQDTIRQLTWLRDNWDDRDVKALMRIDPKGAGFMNEESIRDGINTLKKDIVVVPGKPVEYGSRIPPKANWGADNRPPSADPNDKPHEWYVSDGKGNTVAVDYDGNGKMIYTVGTVDASGNAHYTGWHYERETGKYILVDKDKTNDRLLILAEATAIDFEPSTGKLTPRGLMPRPSQEERARQAGTY
jgi:hypothetical protein